MKRTPIIITALVILAAITMMLVGWRNLKARQAQIPEPFAEFDDTIEHRFDGLFIRIALKSNFEMQIAVFRIHVVAGRQFRGHGKNLFNVTQADNLGAWACTSNQCFYLFRGKVLCFIDNK